MQSETADFAPVPPHDELHQTTLCDVQAPSGELDEIHASPLILAHRLIMRNHDVIYKTRNM